MTRMKLIKFYPDDGSRGPIVVNQDRIDGITEEYGKAIIHVGSLKFRVRQSQKEVCEMLQKSEDTVTVTRCKDCQLGGECDEWMGHKAYSCKGGETHDENWFCADGKPKEDAK